MNIPPFIAVVQLVLIIAYIAGADLGDLITRLPQTADVDLVMAVPIQLFQSLGNKVILKFSILKWRIFIVYSQNNK